jgi:dienelactone hydrolase
MRVPRPGQSYSYSYFYFNQAMSRRPSGRLPAKVLVGMSISPLGLLLLSTLTAGALLFPELRRPPDGQWPRLASPLAAPGEPPVTTTAGWKRRRERLEREWKALLGPMPERVPLKPEIVSTEEVADHTRQLLRYRTEAGATTEAYLLLPKGYRGKRPGMVVLHQTTDEHIRQAVGLSGREPMHIALHLVRRGYVCIAPRNFLWSEPGKGYGAVTAEILQRSPWKTGMAKMTWDAIRATDLLAGRPEVDRDRIGSIGHSLGGKEVLYHAAFDRRVRAAVSCEGGIGLSFSNWDADWYLGKQIKQPGFNRDHQDVLALVAPRAFLLIGGESADGAKSWPYIDANLPVWRIHSAEARLGVLRHPSGHDFPAPGADRDLVYSWLDHWLAKREDER